MELRLSETLDFALDDKMEIDLPSFVARLDPETIAKDVERSKLIVAAGTDPQDQKITLITGDGKILIFDTQKYFIPPGPSAPCDGGRQIFFENISGRWPGETPGFFADADWIIEKSVSALTEAVLRVNYPHEDKSQ